MADNSIPPIPDRLAKWRSEGETVELMGRQIWYHDSGPKTDDAVFIVHGYPGSSWDFQGVVDRIGDSTRTVVMLSLIHISEPTRQLMSSRMPSSA